jgi:hypothetical protein
MVIVRAIEILGNVHILDPQLFIYESTISIDKADLRQPYRFYFGARQHNTCRKSLGKDIVKRSPAVLYIYVGNPFVHK